MHRAAVRHFANIDEALWKKDKLLLDGVTWIDNLNSKVREIKYIGKGTITSFNAGFTPEQKLPKILPDDDSKDFLNLWFHGGPNGDFLTTDAEQLQLSLYASNGINPKRDLDIIGNILLNNKIKLAIISNTSDGTRENLKNINKFEKGGLSGKPLRKRSTEVIRLIAEHTNGEWPIIGVGGISTADDAWEKITHGAWLVQIYSAMVFHGPSVIKKINTGLQRRLKEEGLTSLDQAIGAALR